jgi:hypothetical protein
LLHSQNNGARLTNESNHQFVFGKASASATGARNAMAGLTKCGKDSDVTLAIGANRVWTVLAAALAIGIVMVAACGRGPVFPPTGTTAGPGTITFKFYVSQNGSINAGNNAYIIALNINQGTNNVYGSPEQPGYPTLAEAQGLTYSHWDQLLFYGVCPTQQTQNFFCIANLPSNNFYYADKSFIGVGQTLVRWQRIFLAANQFTFFTNASFGGGTSNAMTITIPIKELDVRPTPSPNPTPTSSANPLPTPDNIYVQLFTADASGNALDQMTCGLNSQDTIPNISLSTKNVYTFSACGNKPGGGPSDPNAYILGGEIDVIPLPSSSP